MGESSTPRRHHRSGVFQQNHVQYVLLAPVGVSDFDFRDIQE